MVPTQLREHEYGNQKILTMRMTRHNDYNISDIKYVINIDYPTQTEDYVHRIGRTARNSNTGTAFTLVTSENSKHVPKLIDILREANQIVSDNLLALVKNNGSGFRNGPGRFQKPIYNSHDNYNGNGASKGAYKRLSNFDESYNREDKNDYNGTKRLKRNRWDDSPSENGQSENGFQNHRAGINYNSSQNSYQNKYQNGNSYANRYQMTNPPMAASDLLGQNENQYFTNVQTSPQMIPTSLPPPPQAVQNGTHLPPPLMPNSSMYQAYANYI